MSFKVATFVAVMRMSYHWNLLWTMLKATHYSELKDWMRFLDERSILFISAMS